MNRLSTLLTVLIFAAASTTGCIELGRILSPPTDPDGASPTPTATATPTGETDDSADGDVGPAPTVEPTDDADGDTAGDDAADGDDSDAAGDSNDSAGDSDDNADDGADDADDSADEDGVPALPDDAVIEESETGLRYYDYEIGDGEQPTLESQVTVAYTGYLEDGTIFDSSEGAQFFLTGVVDGFGEGVAGMRVGGRRRLIIPPDLGYGASGNPGAGIGGEDTIIFDVTLISIDN